MSLTLNKKYKQLYENTTRFFIITGGRGSGKSFEVGAFASALSFETGHKILFTRYTMKSANDSIIPEFQEKIELIGANHLFDINKSEIKNKQSGSDILFRGIKTSSGDQTANLKSLKGITTWILDEAEELVNESVFDKINWTVRQKGKQNRIIIMLNPSTKEHWIYKRFFESVGVQEGFCGSKGDVTYIHTSYLDNLENLEQSFLDDIQRVKETNIKKYNHVILGGWLDKAEGVVFTNWEFGTFNPDNLQTSFGQDYGFSIDPTTLVEVAIDKAKKIIYIKEHLYKSKLTTSEIAHINKSIAGNKLIVADSAEPRLIDELVKLGCRVVPTAKGAGSINAGIAIMQDYKLIIDGENIGKEMNNYVYTDKGSKLFCDNWNHAIDAIRYNVSYNLSGGYQIEIR